jgi:putative molybdopterin biosynthesis protein
VDIDLKLRWRIGGEELPETLIRLLDGVARGGSLLFAARDIPVSYRHAWGLVRHWETKLGRPLVTLEQGRGATLTEAGDSFRRRWYDTNERTESTLVATANEVTKALAHEFDLERAAALMVCASHGFGISTAIERWREAGFAITAEYIGSDSALRRYAAGECQAAGFHLPSGRLGKVLWQRYRPYLDTRRDLTLLVETRELGFMARVDSPPVTIEGLATHRWRFINRQGGSGSRQVFDLLLAEAQKTARDIEGYNNEEYTHLAVAAVIAANGADVGFGARSAAARFALQFWPALTEKYLIVVPRKVVTGAAYATLAKILRGKAYRTELAAIPGCDGRRAGQAMSLAELAHSLGK